MTEFINRNLNPGPRYYYRVDTFVSAHGKSGDLENSYSHSELFDSGNMLIDRKRATAYYEENLEKYQGPFVYPLSTPSETLRERSTYSITLSLIESEDGEEFEYPLLGEEDEETAPNLELELSILEKHHL